MKGLGTATVEFYDNGFRQVVYHKTVIYKENDEYIILNNGGWATVTTTKKMNQALHRHGHVNMKVKSVKGVQKLFKDDKSVGTIDNQLIFNKYNQRIEV